MPSSRSPTVVVRPLASPAEHEMYFQLADQAFSPNPSPTSAGNWQQFVTSTPEYRPEPVRGAFRGEEELGGYMLYKRALRMGNAIRLTPQTLVQILFGYRPVAWALQQSAQIIPDDLLSILNVLFPLGHTWIPASDWF